MKISGKIIAAAAAAAMCLNATPVYAAENTDTSYADLIYDEAANSGIEIPYFTNTDEAADYVKSCLKQHIEEFCVRVELGQGKNGSDTVSDIAVKYSELTDDPTEGIYLSVGTNINPTYRYSRDFYDIYIDYSVTYYTTLEQEEELTAAIAVLKDTPEFDLARSSDVYYRALWVYDQVIANMNLNDDNNNPEYSTAYSALVKKDANENGQVALMVRLLQEVGLVPSTYVSNLKNVTVNGADGHVLGEVSIDGVYYFLDPVWDYKMGGDMHRFFLKGYYDLDSESDGSEEFTHIHLLELVGVSAEKIIERSTLAAYSYERPSAPENCSDGDVNGDEEVNAVDASLTLQEYALLSGESGIGRFTESQSRAADIDENGFVDAVDASRILAYYAYISTLDEETVPQNVKQYNGV